MLFSATLDAAADVLARRFMTRPAHHDVGLAEAPPAMIHHLLTITPADRVGVVTALAGGSGRTLVFARTRHAAHRLARQLTSGGVPAAELHGDLSQGARERNLAAFTGGGARVIVATDIAARGIHVDGIDLVIHADPPAEHKAYLHRSGRTARAGSAGDVVTLVLPTQRKDTAALLRKAEISVVPQHVTAASDAVNALVGEVAAYVKPAPRAAVQPQGGGRSRQSQGGRTGGGRSQGGSQGGSQGANAQRKRAARDGAASGAPRSERTGGSRNFYSTASGEGAPSGAPRSGGQRSGASRSGAPRTGGARSGGAGRAGSGGGLVGMSQGGGNRRGR